MIAFSNHGLDSAGSCRSSRLQAECRRGGKLQSVPKQGFLQARPRRGAAGEDCGARTSRLSSAAGAPEKRVEPPGDCRRRIDIGDRPWREPLELVDEQRKMGAGEHDVIRSPSMLLDEAWRNFMSDFTIVDRLAAYGAL